MYIEVKINNEEIILLGNNSDKNGITEIEFIFDSPDDTKEKNFNNIIGLKLKGVINLETKDEILKLAQWAITTESSKIYRDVNICIYSGDINSDTLREIILTAAFVVDYNENFIVTKEDPGYDLTLRQKFDKKSEIRIY